MVHKFAPIEGTASPTMSRNFNLIVIIIVIGILVNISHSPILPYVNNVLHAQTKCGRQSVADKV